MIFTGGYEPSEACQLPACRVTAGLFGGMEPFDRSRQLSEQVADHGCAVEGILWEHN